MKANRGPTIPVRMYLTQMGEIPLLTRQQEIYLAKQIEITRRRFRRKLLECDYVIQAGLQGAQARARRRAAVRPHGAGLGDRSPGKRPDPRPLAAQPADARDPAQAESPTTTASPLSKSATRRQAQGGLDAPRPPSPPRGEAGRRARSAHPADRADDPHARRVSAAASTSCRPRSTPTSATRAPPAERKPWLIEYRNILRRHAGNAHQPAQPRAAASRRSTRSTSRPSAGCRKATCGWSCRSPRSIATAACRSST